MIALLACLASIAAIASADGLVAVTPLAQPIGSGVAPLASTARAAHLALDAVQPPFEKAAAEGGADDSHAPAADAHATGSHTDEHAADDHHAPHAGDTDGRHDASAHAHAHSSSDGCEHGHEAHEHHHMHEGGGVDDEMAVSMILFLILITIGFEKLKHQLEHQSSASEKIVVEALFGEVTVLGFIALITFFMIKSGVFESISLVVYHDSTHALHLFEDVHFALFFTMMLYLALVLWVLYVQSRTSAKWRDLEEQTRKFLRDNAVDAGADDAPAAVPAKTGGSRLLRQPKASKVKVPALPMPKDEYLEWKYNGGGRIPVGFDGVMNQEDDVDIEELGGQVTSTQHEDDQVHKYMILRARFIWGCTNGEGRKNSQVDHKFDFARYLSNALAETLTQVVIVHEITWVAIAVVIIVAYGFFAGASDTLSCLIMTAMGFALVGSMLWLNLTVRRIQAQLSPPDSSNMRQVLTGHKNAMPFYDGLEAKKGMSKHEQLFPLGAAGPHFLQHWLRTTLLLAAVYVVGLGVVFTSVMFENGLQFLLPVCLLSALVTIGLVWSILPRITIITSTAMLKRVKLIEQTIREVRLERSLNTIKILAALQSQLRKIRKLQGQPRDDSKTRREISAKHKADLLEVFRLFDTDNSNSIDSKELYNLLQDLGQQVEQADAERLILEMDSGGNGEVSFEEFCEVMADDDDAPPENSAEIAKDMFKMLDKDNSGQISLGEFRAFLVKLPMDIEDDAIDAMLNDIFGDDDDAAIDVHEFEHFLTSSAH